MFQDQLFQNKKSNSNRSFKNSEKSEKQISLSSAEIEVEDKAIEVEDEATKYGIIDGSGHEGDDHQ